jgi:phytoene dehydrogenase-like protein
MPTPSAPVLIIGGGIAGLSCGCYLQMNGIPTVILEAGANVGGLCAAWDRGDYVFDGCMRWLVGTHPASAFNRIWTELGALAGREVVNHEESVRIEGANGNALSVPTDLDRLAQEFTRIAPEDTKRIRELVRAARRCVPLEPPIEKPLELMTPLEKLKTGLRYLPMVPVISRWKSRPVTAYIASYRNPFLREVLAVLAGDPRVSALVLVVFLAFRSSRNAGSVKGGSRAFAGAIARRYKSLGGQVRCHASVESVTVEGGRATGVRCADGTAHPASTVVSCADGHTTLYGMLGGRFLNKDLRFAYETCDTFRAIIQVSLGINRTFRDAPHTLSLALARPLEVDDQTRHHRIEVTVFAADQAICPADKTVMTVGVTSRCEYWTQLRDRDPDRYLAEKERVLQETIGALDRRFPGLAQSVEQHDVATPATFVRHTGNWQGSYEGWLPTPRILGRRLPRTLPGLEDLYMAGHWVEPGGGLPFAALSGRYAAQLICARRGKKFVASGP